MIKKILLLGSRRRRIAARIQLRQQELREGGSRLHDRVDAYFGTPQSLLHGFLAGFLLDQARPIVPDGPSPLRFVLPSLLRWLT